MKISRSRKTFLWPIMLPGILFLAFAAGDLHADYFILRAYESDGTIKAFPSSSTGQISIDWKTLIPKEISSIPPEGPIPFEFRDAFDKGRYLGGYVEFKYENPPPAIIGNYFFYLITDQGVSNTRIEKVEAEINFVPNRKNYWGTGPRSFRGSLIPERTWNYGEGFLFVSGIGLEMVTESFPIKAGTILVGDQPTGDIEIGAPDSQIKTSFLIIDKTSKRQWIYLSLIESPNADGAIDRCAMRSFILTSNDKPKILAWHYSGCDV